MVKNKIEVVLLPTEDKSRIVNNHGRLAYFKVKRIGITKHTVPQNVYVTVSQDVEPIKEGDY